MFCDESIVPPFESETWYRFIVFVKYVFCNVGREYNLGVGELAVKLRGCHWG